MVLCHRVPHGQFFATAASGPLSTSYALVYLASAASSYRLVLAKHNSQETTSTTTGTSNGILLLWIGQEASEEQLKDPG